MEAWQELGIPPLFAERQQQVLEAFARMKVVTTCTCTPYLVGNLPHFGQHIAWSESSAVCYANAVLGARTNREGGPSALAAALTGRTPDYGCHLAKNRRPTLTFEVRAPLTETQEFGALGIVIGKALEKTGASPIAYIRGIPAASVEGLKSFCASLATYGGAALFHMEGITPEAGLYPIPDPIIQVTQAEIEQTCAALSDSAPAGSADFYSLGCPHLSLAEIAHLADLLDGKQVKKEFWITTARPVKQMADRMGYTATIEASGAKFAADTCCVVAPIAGRFKTMATDSAKACYYAFAKNKFQTRLLPFDQVVREALL
jgi:predicted aconitase